MSNRFLSVTIKPEDEFTANPQQFKKENLGVKGKLNIYPYVQAMRLPKSAATTTTWEPMPNLQWQFPNDEE